MRFAVQLCWADIRATRHDSQTVRARDGLQNHGARQRIHARQKEGKLKAKYGYASLAHLFGQQKNLPKHGLNNIGPKTNIHYPSFCQLLQPIFIQYGQLQYK